MKLVSSYTTLSIKRTKDIFIIYSYWFLQESKLSLGADVEEPLSKIETGIVQSDKTIFNDIEMEASSQPSVQMLSETKNQTNIITDESVSDETGFQKISFAESQENIIVSSSKKVVSNINYTFY